MGLAVRQVVVDHTGEPLDQCNDEAPDDGMSMGRSVTGRVLVGALGVIVVVIGLVWWTLEGEYGSSLDLNFVVEEGEGDVVRVYEVDEGSVGPEEDPRAEPVFEGTGDEAREYEATRRAEGTNYLVPGFVIAAGALLVLAALVPRKR